MSDSVEVEFHTIPLVMAAGEVVVASTLYHSHPEAQSYIPNGTVKVRSNQ